MDHPTHSRRFDQQNRNWPRDDYSRYDDLDPAKAAVASQLGLATQIDAIRTRRSFGMAAGKLVGDEHCHGLLRLNLRLDDFQGAPTSIREVSHHFFTRSRAPLCSSAMATSIRGLYEQMDYIQWQGFREGYLSQAHTPAAEALIELEGAVVLRIAAAYFARSASQQTRSGNFESAFKFCSIIEELARARPNSSEAQLLGAKGELVRGDVLLSARRYEEACNVYMAATDELADLERQGLDVESEMCGGLINLSIVCKALSRKKEELCYLQRAEAFARRLAQTSASAGAHMLRVIHASMKGPLGNGQSDAQ